LKGNETSAIVDIPVYIAPGKYYFLIQNRTKDDKEVETLFRGSEFSVVENWKKAGKAWSGMVPLEHTWGKVE